VVMLLKKSLGVSAVTASHHHVQHVGEFQPQLCGTDTCRLRGAHLALFDRGPDQGQLAMKRPPLRVAP
jgi:hypothetical protein